MSTANDELMLLWQQAALGSPDPEEVARVAGRATVTRFDKAILRRNLMEYGAGLVMLVVFGFQLVRDDEFWRSLVGFVCVGFVLLYLWWQHRQVVPLDPATDARAYRDAMLARIDQQIRLLKTVRYWYLLPLYLPGLLVMVNAWKRSPVAAVIGWAVTTAVFIGVGWLNERVGVARLRAEREKIEMLYQE